MSKEQTLLIELDPRQVLRDDDRFPDRGESYIYAHLRRYCEKFSPLPTVTLALEPAGPVVMRGHKYLRIALELQRATIRGVVLHADLESELVRRFLDRPDVRRLDLREELRLADAQPVLQGWHVFFFERALAPDDRRAFEADVVAYLEEVGHPLLAPYGHPRVDALTYFDGYGGAEFRAYTPVGDERWSLPFIVRCRRFSEQHARIVSYQGARFAQVTGRTAALQQQ